MDGGTEAEREEFVRQLLAAQNGLRSFILARVGNLADAENILQEVSLVLWKKSGERRETSGFMKWAMGVAWKEILHARRTAARSRVVFDGELAEKFAGRYEELEPELKERRCALQACLERLPESARQLLDLRYQDRLPVEAVAAASGRTVGAVHTALSRTRDILERCINAALGHASPGGEPGP